MPIGIEPTVDYAFKRVFGQPQNAESLISLLNAILQRPSGSQVESVEILNPFLPTDGFDDKQAILDIRARDQMGRQFNVEMQVRPHHALSERLLFYWSRMYSGQLGESEDFTLLRPTISVLLLDAILFPGLVGPHRRFRLRDETGTAVFSNHIEMHLLELPKFDKQLADLGDDLDKWLFFLRNAAGLDVNQWPVELAASPWQRAGKELTMLSQTDIERETYESRRMGQLAYLTDMRVEHQMGIELGEIRILLRLLRRTSPRSEELEGLTHEELQALRGQLVDDARQAGFDV